MIVKIFLMPKELQGQPFHCFYSNQIKGSEICHPIVNTGGYAVVSANQADKYLFKVINRNAELCL